MTDPGTLMREAFAALAAKDVDALQAFHHDDLVEEFVVLGPITGRGEIRAFFTEMFEAIPDLKFQVERIMGVDERVAVGEWSLTGTFSGGPFQGLRPTGKPISLRGVDIMEFEDGLLIHNTIYYDGLGFARQVGMLPAEGTAADKAIMRGFNAITGLKNRLRKVGPGQTQ